MQVKSMAYSQVKQLAEPTLSYFHIHLTTSTAEAAVYPKPGIGGLQIALASGSTWVIIDSRSVSNQYRGLYV